ncbi:hypothetical protein A2801_01370 [Candidatus Woesebacteria bacterium RIFCSPHIGHO2_01_FULL_41_10]|uniref:Uncharacterized protein n=1 Tax=Candidatus Woesebacteria bacterium RIFCSPHIGHO2_01_FULL_41_10 TaxID=1802500 RepID=A0A1F7YUE5_9BACT|nr:MAG: hypothetical protein A2801_01370 [Candidatus Woesebacteria bacterium RIFCSPHIGHO2_01_FULL_41_10]
MIELEQIEFYDVKKRAKVSVPASSVQKTKYERTTKDGGTQVRYAVKAEVDGSKLTKFVSKEVWDNLNVPVV